MRRLGLAGLGCAAAIALSACGKADESPAPAATPAASAGAAAAATPAAPAQPAAMRVRGVGVVGKDGYGITLCGEGTQRIATLQPAAQATLDAFLAGNARQFRVDAWGDLVGTDKLTVRAFERIATEGLGCDEREFRYLFKAYGTEPFWNLDLDVAQGTFQRPDQDAISGETKQSADADGTRHFSVDTLSGKIEATLSPKPCSDGMSDTTLGWTAKVVVGTETLTGCAHAGPAATMP